MLGLLTAALFVASRTELRLARAVRAHAREHESGTLDVFGFVQLQLQARSGTEHQIGAGTTKPNTTELCFVQDNRCFDGQLEAGYEESALTEISGSRFAEIVVTRKGEDVRWLDALPELPAIVYDRGGSPTLLPRTRSNLHIVPQANTGREDDEMLRHIIANYDRLPNITVFLQGWPLLHCAGILGTVRRTLNFLLRPDATLHLGNGAMEGLAPLSRTFYEYYEPEGLLGYTRSMTEAHEMGDDALERALVLYAKTCRSILGKPCPERLWVAEGAQWAVSRERIQSQPLEVYQRALELGEGYQGKLRGLVLEAVWPLLWSANGWNPQAGAASALAEVPPGTGAEPDADWCQRWWWTWVCDQAGLPVGQHRRRSQHPKGAYGGFSKSLVHSTDGHCAAPDGNDALLWSCEDRMAFCELQRWQSGDRKSQSPKRGESQQFLLQRSRFHVHSRLSSGQLGSQLLEMIVRIKAPLLAGAPSFVAVHAMDNRLWLQPLGTQWYLASVPLATPTQHSNVLATIAISTTDTHGPTHFLMCNGVTGEAQLAPDMEAWEILAAPDGFVHLRSSMGGLLQFGAGPSYRLFCQPEGHPDAQVFSLELEEHAPPRVLLAEADLD